MNGNVGLKQKQILLACETNGERDEIPVAIEYLETYMCHIYIIHLRM